LFETTKSLKTKLLGINLSNPTIMPAGFLGVSADSLIRAYDNGAGAVTTKSISLEERNGHANPTVLSFGYGLINAVGLSNPGIDEYVEEIKEVKKRKIPLILNTIGDDNQDFVDVAKMGEAAGVDIIEINISCPNVVHRKPYYADPELLSGRAGRGRRYFSHKHRGPGDDNKHRNSKTGDGFQKRRTLWTGNKTHRDSLRL